MPASQSSLQEEFVSDHRRMTQTIAQLLDALRAGRDAAAIQLADDLDRCAGPHIAFEEAVMYPRLTHLTGKDPVRRMYDEHRIALRGLRQLLAARDSLPLDGNRRAEVIDDLQRGLDHAISCGSLLSHLTTLDSQTQQHLLGRLTEFRSRGTRWSALHP